jgi:hypothetical protein
MFASAGQDGESKRMSTITHALKSRRTVVALAIVASTAWTPVAWTSEFPAVIPLSSLDGSIGFRLDGVKDGDTSGRSVANAGDVNGDGFDEVIIGAARADPHGKTSGSSYVIFGRASGFAASANLSTLDGTNGVRLDGVATYARIRARVMSCSARLRISLPVSISLPSTGAMVFASMA